LTLGSAAGIQTLGANTDIILLGLLATEEEAGLYKVALNGALFVASVCSR